MFLAVTQAATGLFAYFRGDGPKVFPRAAFCELEPVEPQQPVTFVHQAAQFAFDRDATVYMLQFQGKPFAVVVSSGGRA